MSGIGVYLPWDSLPQGLAEVNPKWVQRGLKSAYLLQPGIWDRNLVTGQVGGTLVGSGVTFEAGKLRTPNASGSGALLAHGLALNVALPITLVVGWRRLAGTVSWSLLRTTTSTWAGWYGQASGEITTTNDNSFDGALAFGDTDGVAFSHASATSLVGFAARKGRLSDGAAVAPTSVANPNVVLGFSQRDTASNPAQADFTHFYAFQGALNGDELDELANNPGALFAPRTIWVPVSAGGATTHDTTGALTGAGSTVAGSAAHIAVHGTSGALTGQGSVVAGASARTRAHPTSGALTGPGSVVDGSADHVVPGGDHDTSGALVGQGSIVDGTAARVAAPVTHDTSGELVGPGAVVSGQASGPNTQAFSGGWFPPIRRRTKKEIDEERRKLGILPPEVVEEVAAAPIARRRITLQDLIGKKAAAEITNVDLSQAIAASKKRKRQRDDELLLLM